MSSIQEPGQRWNKMRNIWNIIDRLRGKGGCPWDRKQTPASVQIYLVEEAHEAAAAVRANQMQEVADELGDLLFMVLFLIHLYEEEGVFRLEDVCDGVCNKMKRRHPHIFGDLAVHSAEEVVDNWERIKADEKASSGKTGLGIPESLPALMRGYRMLARLASKQQAGWNDLPTQVEGLSHQHQVLRQCLCDGQAVPPQVFGEFLLSLVNLARLKGCHAETCLHEVLGRLEEIGKSMDGNSRRS